MGKLIKYTKKSCELCSGMGYVLIKNSKRKQSDVWKAKSCPLCDGKGYLGIIIEEKL